MFRKRNFFYIFSGEKYSDESYSDLISGFRVLLLEKVGVSQEDWACFRKILEGKKCKTDFYNFVLRETNFQVKKHRRPKKKKKKKKK